MNFAGLVHSAAVAVVVASALAGASRPALAGARAEAHSQAGRPAPTALQVTAQRPGTVIGTVLGPNHRPLPGVCVTATSLGRPASPATPATPGGRTAVTSRTGTFALPGLAQGAYSLAYRRCTGPDGQVSWPEAALRPSALLAPQRPSTAFVTGGRLTMLSPVTVGPVELTAPRPSRARPRPGDPIALGEISGTVTSPSGHGVAQECVGLFDPQGNGIAVTLTSKQGAYHLKGLLAGRYGVQFFTDQVCGKPNRYLAQWWPGTANETKRGLIRLRKGAHRNHIDAKLVVGATITGTVGSAARAGAR